MLNSQPKPAVQPQAKAIMTRKGRAVHIRNIQPSDTALLVDLFKRLSAETIRRRFFAAPPSLPDEVIRERAVQMADLDAHTQAARVAVVDEDGHERIVGVARLACDADDHTVAEIALVVRDDYQGEGLGRALFEDLEQLARSRGLRCLSALVQAENTTMRRLLQSAGLPITSETTRGETMLRIAL
jgi:GNAT superfamily N-acetyltransferase